ncbi:DUF421 domain-containing protein [Psychrobacillus sp. FSL K6-2365]|uniref:DUF421 domain-containing protein n=1 Tax=Psychrobacillus sp. FSL K6-2365 TaxID=2921546 RepID=UPI0030F582BC
MDLNLIWKSILIIVVGIMLIRFSGRRSISQMTISQTVIMISIGTLLIQPIANKSVWTTFLLAAILIITLIIIEFIQTKWDFTETFFTGKAKIIIENGKLKEKNLYKVRLTVDKLEMRLRQNGIESISDVQWATLEPSGQLGYSLVEKKKFATKEDVKKIQNTLDAVLNQLNQNSIQNKTQDTNISPNIFSEIENGHSQQIDEHLQ